MWNYHAGHKLIVQKVASLEVILQLQLYTVVQYRSTDKSCFSGKLGKCYPTLHWAVHQLYTLLYSITHNNAIIIKYVWNALIPERLGYMSRFWTAFKVLLSSLRCSIHTISSKLWRYKVVIFKRVDFPSGGVASKRVCFQYIPVRPEAWLYL